MARKSKSVCKNNRAETTLAKQRDIWLLRTKAGLSQSSIAERVGITQQRVSEVLKDCTKRYASAFIKHIKNIKTQQIAQLETLIEDCWLDWQKSRQKHGENIHGVGDHHYVEQIRKLLADIRLIVGANYVPVAKGDFKMSFDTMPDAEKEKFFASLPLNKKLSLVESLIEQVKAEEESGS